MRRRTIILSITALILAAGAALHFGVGRTGLKVGQKVMTSAGTDGKQQADAAAQGQADEAPFACNMQAISAEERPRHLEVIGQMRQAMEEIKELPDGYAFRFAASQPSILLASEFVARERACCPFFTFELVVERNDGPIWLSLRGREGVKDFIRAEFSL